MSLFPNFSVIIVIKFKPAEPFVEIFPEVRSSKLDGDLEVDDDFTLEVHHVAELDDDFCSSMTIYLNLNLSSKFAS